MNAFLPLLPSLHRQFFPSSSSSSPASSFPPPLSPCFHPRPPLAGFLLDFRHRSSSSSSSSSSAPSSSPSSSRFVSVRCSSGGGGGSQDPHSRNGSSRSAEGGEDGWDEDDSKYLEAHVVDAVSLLPSQGHLFMMLADGARVEVDHVYRPKGSLLFRSRNPTIFLKVECESELLLPIVVGEMAIGMLMSALHGEENVVRPNQYHVMRDLVGSLDFEIKMVRVTERIGDTYLARIYIGKPGEKQLQSVDARPSDAINLAVRCKVPIFVNKDIVFTDAVTPIPAGFHPAANNEAATSILDTPVDGKDLVAEELILLRNMLVAVVEERYADAARWRDELNSLRRRS